MMNEESRKVISIEEYKEKKRVEELSSIVSSVLDVLVTTEKNLASCLIERLEISRYVETTLLLIHKVVEKSSNFLLHKANLVARLQKSGNNKGLHESIHALFIALHMTPSFIMLELAKEFDLEQGEVDELAKCFEPFEELSSRILKIMEGGTK